MKQDSTKWECVFCGAKNNPCAIVCIKCRHIRDVKRERELCVPS